jgi:hypothetical protein
MAMLPVLYPGFKLDQPEGQRAAGQSIPASAASSHWRFSNAADLGIDMA